jgi:hypothetical protein
MADDAFEATWQQINAEVLAEMTAWRRTRPRATLTEIEQAMDHHLAQARARLFHQLAQDTPATDWRSAPTAEQPTCPDCGVPLRPNGTATRHLQTQGGVELALERTYGVCPTCGIGFFPPG